MKHAATQSLYAYWNWLRAGRAAPERADIDPAAIRGVLADTFMVEVEDLGPKRGTTLAVRLSGTRVNALFNSDLKGRSLPSLWRAEDTAAFQLMIAAVLDDSRAAVAGLVGAPRGHDPLGLELLLLPLRHNGKTHARLLGALSPAAIPTWLGLVPVEPLTLVSQRIIDNPAGMLVSRPLYPASTSRPSHRLTPTRRGHFIIYQGGRTDLREDCETGVR